MTGLNLISHRGALSALAAAALFLGCAKGGTENPSPTAPPSGNNNPTVNINTDKTHLAYGESASISITASDPDGDQLTFSWSAGRGTVSSSGPTATVATFVAANSFGPCSVTVTVSDGRGGTAQATTSMYIRNPDPPGFSFLAASTSGCGFGTPNPEGFVLQFTPDEAVQITNIIIGPRSAFCFSNCSRARNYSSSPIPLSAGQDYLWSDGGCHFTTCCFNGNCGNCNYWKVYISGRRPEPDGGTFTYECGSWNSGDTGPCN